MTHAGPPPTSPIRPAASPSSPAPTPASATRPPPALAGQGRPRRARRPQPGQGQGRGRPDRAGARPAPTSTLQELDLDVAGLDPRRPPTSCATRHDAHRPADQQRRGDVHPEAGRPRTASSCSSAPTISATSRCTGLLLDRLLAVAGLAGRHRSAASATASGAAIHFDDLQSERSYNRVAAYGQSKLANLLFTYELQRRLAAGDATPSPSPRIPAARRHRAGSQPARLPVRIGHAAAGAVHAAAPTTGALPTLRAATDPGVRGGQYYGPGGLRRGPRPSRRSSTSSR